MAVPLCFRVLTNTEFIIIIMGGGCGCTVTGHPRNRPPGPESECVTDTGDPVMTSDSDYVSF